ncbi:MarC family protein [Brackiella oedipodis]|uniref:MarC family protein n=1 Tax=Brackiella oedipodis TaxID=124225 RepID=UPI000571EC7D|nr:MarC family protein [Brackiella oedipodis]
MTALSSGFFLFFGTVLPILNPLAIIPIFLTITQGASNQTRAQLSKILGWNVFLLLVCTALLGNMVLRLFGISIPIVQVGGGLLVVASSWKLLNAEDPDDTENQSIIENFTFEKAKSNAFFPFTFPLICGPGTLAIALTVATNMPKDTLTNQGLFSVGIAAACAVIGFIIFVCTRYAAKLMHRLGHTGAAVFMRLAAFILLCLGVQIIWSGVQELAHILATQMGV